MNYKDVMQELKSLGSEQTRKTYARHGVVDDMFGVSYANLGALKKKIKTNQELAEQLWKSGNHDARVLATMVADPAKISAKLLDAWVGDINNYPLGDALAALASQTIAARSGVEKWMKSSDEWKGCFGWTLLARMARQEDVFPPEALEKYLEIIERDIQAAKNRVRHAMNSALISIGVRNEKLQKKALAAAARIGKVVVDHGNTDCKTPDAKEYILKTIAHASKTKAARAK